MGQNTGAIIFAGAVAIAFLFSFAAPRAAKMREQGQILAADLWYLSGLIPLAAVCLYWGVLGDQPVTLQRIILGLAGAVVGCAVFLAAGEMIRPTNAANGQPPSGQEKPPEPKGPVMSQNGPSINTWNQSGGTNTINFGPTRLPFAPDLGEELIRRLPPGKPIRLRSVGSTSDHAVADEYGNYLRNRGFNIANRDTIGMLIPPPDHKISIMDTPTEVVVTIAPSAN